MNTFEKFSIQMSNWFNWAALAGLTVMLGLITVDIVGATTHSWRYGSYLPAGACRHCFFRGSDPNYESSYHGRFLDLTPSETLTDACARHKHLVMYPLNCCYYLACFSARA